MKVLAVKTPDWLTGGSVIGHTIAKAIAEAYKGSITVESELERGMEFIVTLQRQLT